MQDGFVPRQKSKIRQLATVGCFKMGMWLASTQQSFVLSGPVGVNLTGDGHLESAFFDKDDVLEAVSLASLVAT